MKDLSGVGGKDHTLLKHLDGDVELAGTIHPEVMMMSKWTAEVGNDPEADFDLIIELLEVGEYRARVRRDASGQLVLDVYGGKGVTMPVEWLRAVMRRAENELPGG
jgi:hypothetical protein